MNIYNKLYKGYYYETFYYSVKLPEKNVVDKLANLFNERSGLLMSPNLRGEFVDYPVTFYLTLKWWLGYIQNFEKEPAILKGVISKATDTETKIEVSVRPNSVFALLSIFFLPYGLYHSYQAISKRDLNSCFIAIWVLFVCLPILFFIAKKLSNAVRIKFERYLEISPIK